MRPGLSGVLGSQEEAQAGAGAAQGLKVGVAWVLIFLGSQFRPPRRTVFCSWDLLLLSADPPISARERVAACSRKLKGQQEVKLRDWLLGQCARAVGREHPLPGSFPELARLRAGGLLAGLLAGLETGALD